MDGIADLEQELVVLARLLEALSRRRTYPLERSHYLLLLKLADGPRRIGDLSRALALDATTVTRQIDAMQARGLVTRQPDPEDRRSALVARTEEGTACAARMRAMREQRIARLLAGWSPDEVERFAGSMGRFNAALYDRLGRTDDKLLDEDMPGDAMLTPAPTR